MPYQNFKKAKVLDSESLLTVMVIPTRELSVLFLDIAVTVTALDQFEIQGRPNEDASFRTIKSAGSDYTSPTTILTDASGDLTAIGAAANGWLIMNCRGMESVRIQAARAAGSNATVTLQGGGTDL